jgi:hypothetical protein
MPMRRLVFTLLCSLLVIPAVALASPRAAGDGVLELQNVDGMVSIGTYKQPAKGAVWGQMDSGKLIVYDPVAGDGTVFVTGWDTKRTVTLDNYPDATMYTGANVHFRVTGGRYRLYFPAAKGIDLTAVGTGTAYLNGDATEDSAGYYAVDSGKQFAVPQLPSVSSFGFSVTFGTPSTP